MVMCGRYTIYTSPKKFAEYFSATLTFEFGKSYNIAPTTSIPVVIRADDERFIVPMRWGLIPSWHKEGRKFSLLNNAKIETVDIKPSFRLPFTRKRCLIIANGFYEWDQTVKPKQPYYYHLKNDGPIAIAGIWDNWISPEGLLSSCCIITTPANQIVSKVHNRMPGIISPDQYDTWLDPELNNATKLKEIITA